MYFVYKITNTVNNKLYIGKTNNIISRWASHCSGANSKRKHYPLYRAMNKYGIENFKLEIIEELETEESCFDRETFWINFFKTNICKFGHDFGYNLTDGGEGCSGHIDSLEQRRNKSKNKIGNKNNFYGKTHSDITKQKISQSKCGKPIPQDVKDKISKKMKGVAKSEETKRKMSLSAIGYKKTQEHCNNISAAKIGKSNNRPGEKHHNSKLTKIEVIEIRNYFKLSPDKSCNKMKFLSHKYNVSISCIKQIVYRMKWKHIS